MATAVNQLRDGLQQQGHDVYVFCPKFKAFSKEEKVYKFRSIQINKNIDFGLTFYPKKQIENIIKEGSSKESVGQNSSI